jgi:hypothetical protein
MPQFTQAFRSDSVRRDRSLHDREPGLALGEVDAAALGWVWRVRSGTVSGTGGAVERSSTYSQHVPEGITRTGSAPDY